MFKISFLHIKTSAFNMKSYNQSTCNMKLTVVFLCLMVSLTLGEHHFKKHAKHQEKNHDDNIEKARHGFGKRWFWKPTPCCPCVPPPTPQTRTIQTSNTEQVRHGFGGRWFWKPSPCCPCRPPPTTPTTTTQTSTVSTTQSTSTTEGSTSTTEGSTSTTEGSTSTTEPSSTAAGA